MSIIICASVYTQKIKVYSVLYSLVSISDKGVGLPAGLVDVRIRSVHVIGSYP